VALPKEFEIDECLKEKMGILAMVSTNDEDQWQVPRIGAKLIMEVMSASKIVEKMCANAPEHGHGTWNKK